MSKRRVKGVKGCAMFFWILKMTPFIRGETWKNPSPTQPLESGGYLPVCYVQVVEEEDGMKPHPSYIDQLVDTPGGLGYLTGNWREQAVTFTAPEHKKWLRYTFGVRLLQDDVERFYLPRTVWEVQPRATQADEQAPEEGLAWARSQLSISITLQQRARKPWCLQVVGSLSGVAHRSRRWVGACHTYCGHHSRH